MPPCLAPPLEMSPQSRQSSMTKFAISLQHLSTQDALFLLRNSFTIPKLLYTIRSSPNFLSPSLQSYDKTLRSIVSDITNINLDDTAWTQASLPVKSGGLGIRSSVQLAPSAFLASAAANSDLAHHILPPRFQSTELPYVAEATKVWSMGLDLPPLSGPASHHQKAWDTPKDSAVANTLLKQAPDAVSRSCLLAASTKESVAWLSALPVSSLGLRMDNNTVRVAVGLRLGSPLCRPHTCYHCGAQVDSTATHGPAANGVRDVINVMLLSTTLSIAHCLQPICLPGWNQLVSPAPMANAPMESR